MADKKLLVRIKPSNARETHVFGGYVITKARGWHEVPEAVGLAAAEEPMSDANPGGVKVFEVKDPDAARAIVAAETLKEDPAGTPDRPAKPVPIAHAPEAPRNAPQAPRNAPQAPARGGRPQGARR